MRHAVVQWLHPQLAELLPERTRRWSHALLARPSVSGSVIEDFHPRFLEFYGAKGGWLFNESG